MNTAKQTVFAFIDGQNLNMGTRHDGWILDFRKFRKLLLEKYGVTEAFYFIGQVEGEEELYKSLGSMGYKLIFKPTTEHDETVKGNVDAELVLHTMIELPNYDKAVIVSGDGDFFALHEYLQQQGKLGYIVVPNPRFSGLIRDKFSSHIVRIDSFKKYLEYKHHKKSKPDPEPS